jgi:hypothetical protein
MNCGTYCGKTAAVRGSVVVAAVMFPFRGTDYGTTASPAKTRLRHPMEINKSIPATPLASAFEDRGAGASACRWRS